ncbi:MAG: hypothetical protein JRI68_34280 [Deltaproteobacteria bacterium]|nr:hypothetical protein [Deltaproteobacteria bacterium]
MPRCPAATLMLALLATAGCSSDETQAPSSDPVGSAEFRVRNDSAQDLSIQCVAAEGSAVACEDGPFVAASGDTVRLGADTVIGGAPVPAYVLDEVSALAVPPGGTDAVVVYSQQPVDNGLWIREIADDSQYGSARYTLVIEDEDLTFPP